MPQSREQQSFPAFVMVKFLLVAIRAGINNSPFNFLACCRWVFIGLCRIKWGRQTDGYFLLVFLEKGEFVIKSMVSVVLCCFIK